MCCAVFVLYKSQSAAGHSAARWALRTTWFVLYKSQSAGCRGSLRGQMGGLIWARPISARHLMLPADQPTLHYSYTGRVC